MENLDLLLEKLRKILALAEHGTDGEKEAATRALNAALAKHHLTLSDVLNGVPTPRQIVYKGPDEKNLLAHILYFVFGSGHERVKEAMLCRSRVRRLTWVAMKMTDVEYIDVSNMFTYYAKVFKKEKKKIMSQIFPAFIHKHELWNKSPMKDIAPAARNLSPEDIAILRGLMGSMRSPSYTVQIPEATPKAFLQ